MGGYMSRLGRVDCYRYTFISASRIGLLRVYSGSVQARRGLVPLTPAFGQRVISRDLFQLTWSVQNLPAERLSLDSNNQGQR